MTLAKLIETDADVRVVYKELPILGPDSVLASRAALAAVLQGKYLQMHHAMLGASEPMTEATILEIAERLGVDRERLRVDLQSPEIGRALERNLALARALGLGGTPAFVIGTETVSGAVGLDVLRAAIARTRGR